MQELIFNIMENFGYFGVLFLLLIENLFPPIPSEVILTFGGFLCNYTKISLILMIIFSTIGVVLGAIILYFLGYLLNKEKIIKLSKSKIGKILRLKEENINNADTWFLKKGYKAVFFCRFVPIVRSLISIPAGMCKMNFLRFIIYTFFGTIIWNSVLLILGYLVGGSWKDITLVLHKYSKLTTYVIIGIILIIIINKYRKKVKK